MNFIKKWYTYQKERFPVLIYGTYIFAIVFATFCFANHFAKNSYYDKNIMNIVAPGPYQINYYKLIPMFIVGFLQFLMVRIVDEFKDYEEDCKYRPYRPVPRGLVTLKELKILFIVCAILQVLVTFFVNSRGVILLLAVWLFFAIMSKGFFMKKFLEKHILVEVFFDELLMPIVVFYLSSFVYFDLSNVWKLLLMSYIISWIVEIARKVRCKDDEENGVKTYTAVFGIPKAMLILFILETILMLIHTYILGKNNIKLTLIPYIIANATNLIFAIKQNKKSAKTTELTANIYVMLCYFSLITLI